MVFLFLHVLLQYLDIICSPVFIICIDTPYHFFDKEQVSFNSWILGFWAALVWWLYSSFCQLWDCTITSCPNQGVLVVLAAEFCEVLSMLG